MSDIIVTAVQLIILIAGLIITKYLLPYLKQKIGSDNLAVITSWVTQAVTAAEQIMQANTGAEKKEYVLNFVREILEENNITLTDDQLNVLIESAVKSLKLEESAKETTTES